jgi:all-trans-8'-apo-beta-carotenal 15,15'-oxygenase
MAAPAPQPTTRRWNRADWLRGYTSLTEERDYWIDDIEGNLPADLCGTLYRNGPGLLERGGQSVQHPFDGDGMICAFDFTGDGRVRFRNRYVRTAGFVAESKAGRFLQRGVFGTQKPGGWLANAFDLRTKNIANTNVAYSPKKLLALWEGGKPYALDPQTLETIGEDDLGGALAGNANFAAHPHYDRRTGEMVNFGIQPGLSSTIALYTLDADLNVTAQYRWEVPGFAFIHDFALTDDYAVFFQNPVTVNPLPYWFGFRGPAECLVFQPDRPTKVHLLPRRGGRLRTYETDACFVFHHVNAHIADDVLTVDSIAYETFPSLEPGTMYRQVEIEKIAASQLFRFTINLKTGASRRERLLERAVEFPSIHPARVGIPHRWAFMAMADAPTGNAPLQGVLAYDTHTGETQTYSFAPSGYVGEPVFVPTPGAAEENAGYLLQMVFDAQRGTSGLAIFDARHVARGPLARLHLRDIVPYGLHGQFVAKQQTTNR